MVYKAAMAMLRATSRAWVQALGSKICIVCMTCLLAQEHSSCWQVWKSLSSYCIAQDSRSAFVGRLKEAATVRRHYGNVEV
jgi:hypothetical protein